MITATNKKMEYLLLLLLFCCLARSNQQFHQHLQLILIINHRDFVSDWKIGEGELNVLPPAHFLPIDFQVAKCCQEAGGRGGG